MTANFHISVWHLRSCKSTKLLSKTTIQHWTCGQVSFFFFKAINDICKDISLRSTPFTKVKDKITLIQSHKCNWDLQQKGRFLVNNSFCITLADLNNVRELWTTSMVLFMIALLPFYFHLKKKSSLHILTKYLLSWTTEKLKTALEQQQGLWIIEFYIYVWTLPIHTIIFIFLYFRTFEYPIRTQVCFMLICILLFTMHIIAKELHRKKPEF